MSHHTGASDVNAVHWSAIGRAVQGDVGLGWRVGSVGGFRWAGWRVCRLFKVIDIGGQEGILGPLPPSLGGSMYDDCMLQNLHALQPMLDVLHTVTVLHTAHNNITHSWQLC